MQLSSLLILRSIGGNVQDARLRHCQQNRTEYVAYTELRILIV